MTEWQRAISFMRAIDLGCAEEIVPFRFGRALINRMLSTVPDLNYLLADRGLESATAADLTGECERIQGHAGIGFRRVNVDDQPAAERLIPGLTELGFTTERFSVMVRHRPPDRQVDASQVRRVDWDTYEKGRRIEVASWAPSSLIAEQVLVKQRLTAGLVDTSYWCALVDGNPASFCEVRSWSAAAQIEFVETLEPFRRRGLARQVVTAALQSVRDRAFVFLVADLFDWPKAFYSRLGFDSVGVETRFIQGLGRTSNG